ncbi:type II toxin-antitoxin system RelE/ParE family toxin [Pseudomonas sp. MSSRFD41]|uniref:type II toxin-antitoxin system RelE/ParE family toxin n=1 Tax=Pseudomonas sp. MSSRFD41 TaxID=1310370 RepID=UPI00163A9706|nr:type II toxin-antitoxin system RelE/ParE family toxin [Pseudomonas sp. MSSRFD41]MBC2655342.1 type II toxin-antitoxin system RelE/ParE family toxin [Pseudomonas sp. MSSRFD41]
MHIEWLRTALKNLDDEARYMAQDNPEAAREFVETLLTGIEHLARFPASGREGRLPGTREWVVPGWPYLIPYRVRGSRLQILCIFHTRRQPPQRW